ncbi:MAG: phosphodiester glycosidase family protein [Candidatus Velthaea sp.]
MAAAALPETLAPAAPFPLVANQFREHEYVAPGVTRGTYHLLTSAGPLVVSFVTFDPREPTVRLATVLAHDRLVSSGETISSMAARTNAVAGINADYFDIGNTNAPVGVLVQNGALLRTPSSRPALAVLRDRTLRVSALRFSGVARASGGAQIPLGAVNEWPPQTGAALITPAYGIPPSAPGVSLAELVPLAPLAGAAPPGGRYRIAHIAQGTALAHPAYVLALGPAAQSALPMQPDVGDIIDVALDTDPPLSSIAAAAGGGPALLQNGIAVDDPFSPGYAERARRIPAAAVALMPDGTGALVVVDGRRPSVSMGVNRAELIALLRALGALDALQFDSGGSATLVARALGDKAAAVQNEPSDGMERPVADGLFVYSDAPAGPPARLVVRPSRVLALPGATIALHAAVVDAAGHALGAARGAWHVRGSGARIDENDVLHAGDAPLATMLHLDRDGVQAELPFEIVRSVTKLAIEPERPNPEPGAGVALRAYAFDARGRRIALGDELRWTATGGSIGANGVFRAGAADGTVTAHAGTQTANVVVRVGRHRERFDAFDEARRATWRFSSVPANGPGSITFAGEGTLRIAYDFTTGERAAYANAGVTVGDPVGFACAIEGDAGGAALRAAFVDRYGERAALTFAKTIDWTGVQRREVRVPAALAPPLVLQSLYVVGSLGTAPVKSAGTIGIRDCDFSQPGSARHAP